MFRRRLSSWNKRLHPALIDCFYRFWGTKILVYGHMPCAANAETEHAAGQQPGSQPAPVQQPSLPAGRPAKPLLAGIDRTHRRTLAICVSQA